MSLSYSSKKQVYLLVSGCLKYRKEPDSAVLRKLSH
jgi:hypothetical protein